MKKKRDVFIYCNFIFIVIILSNCSHQKGEYNPDSSVFPDSIKSFFPGTSDSIELKTIGTNALINDIKQNESKKFNTYYHYQIYCFDNNFTFETAKKELKHLSGRSIDPYGKEVFPIGSEWELLKRFDSSIIKYNYQNLTIDQLIPFFCDMLSMGDDWYSSVSNSCIKENIEIKVLKTGSNSLIDFKLYGKSNEWKLLPIQLKNGFLLGVSINNSNEEIMYWVTTW